MVMGLDRPVQTPTARELLADEWRAANPETPEAIAAFYRDAHGIGDDLDAWHQTAERASWTDLLVRLARQEQVHRVVDIGAGAGHDLAAISNGLRTADYPLETWAVEPNVSLYRHFDDAGIDVVGDVVAAPIESADLLICIDVLEHVHDPETFLGTIAKRAAIGCLLVEATATFDLGTPLHLKENIGWHPGRVLEQHGWVPTEVYGRLRFWRRLVEVGAQTQSLLLCAYRSVSADTMGSILALCGGTGHGWRVRTKIGDALIGRSRAITVSRWFLETNDDVFLMVDDDIAFARADADRLVALCRDGHPIICGAYPVHDGAHLACRPHADRAELVFGPGRPPLEIIYAATGFMAVHRRVIEALVADLPLCHAKETWAFYPLFPSFTLPNEGVGGWELLSEDWGFSELARRKGFAIHLDMQTKLAHHGQAALSISNMAAMHHAIAQL